MSDPYEHLPPKQAASLTLGCKIRYAKGLTSFVDSANRMYAETFLPYEVEIIKEIAQDAQDRAHKAYEATQRKIDTIASASEVGSGSETEHRQYNGK